MRTALFLIALAACGNGGATPDPDSAPPSDGPPPDLGPPRQTITTSQFMEVGQVAEAEMIGGPADRAVIKLTAPVPELDWNVHSHPDGMTINVITEMNVMTVVYDFVPESQFDWYLLMRNSGPTEMTVQVVVDLYGAMTFDFIE